MSLRRLIFREDLSTSTDDVPPPPSVSALRSFSDFDLRNALEAGVGFLGADVSEYLRNPDSADPLINLRDRIKVAEALTAEVLRRHGY